jgi:D-inositol-3-phosphate glycosyltransferase
MSLRNRQYLPGFTKANPLALSSIDRSRPAIALISEHGDPAAEVGKEAAGGQNVYVRQVGEALAALGYQVDMFTRKANPYDPEIVQHSPSCRTIRLIAGPQSYVSRDEMMPYMPEFVESLLRFQNKHSMNYQVIHTHYWMSGWVGIQLRQHYPVKLIHTYHSLGAVKYLSIPEIPPIANQRLAIEKDILENYDCVVATSPQEQDDLRQLVSTLGHTQVIPCGTDVENFQVMSKPVSRDTLNIDLQDKVILYVGRFDERKGIETLVRAVGQIYAGGDDAALDLDRLRLVIVGGSDPSQSDGQERLRIEKLVAELGITDQTDFVGMVGHDRLPLYYSAADVCVVPSHYEPFGLVAIEAMACGTPVVASAVGGLNFTVVDEETGLLVPPQNVDGFAQAIKRTLVDRVWAQKARKKSAQRVLTYFSWSGVAQQLSDLYRELLADPQLLLTNPLPAKVVKFKVSSETSEKPRRSRAGRDRSVSGRCRPV